MRGKNFFLPDAVNYFTFKNEPCICNIDVSHDNNGDSMYSLQIINEIPKDCRAFGFSEKNNDTNNDTPLIFFEYRALSGLVKTDADGNVNTGKNIIGDFMKIELDESRKYAERLKKFIEKYGFFFPVPQGGIMRFKCEDLKYILERLHNVFSLLIEVNKPNPNYSKILNLVLYFNMCSDHTLIETDNGKIIYKTCVHPFYKYLNDLKSIPIENNNAYFKDNPLDYLYDPADDELDIEREINEYSVNNKPVCETIRTTDNEKTSTKNETQKMSNPKNNIVSIAYMTYDTFIEDWIILKISYKGGRRITDFGCSRLRELYYTLNDRDIYARNMVDFLHHLIEFAPQHETDQKSNEEDDNYTWLINFDCNNNVFFDQKYIDFMIKLAKQALKLEFDSVISKVHPKFNIETMRPDWIIPDLYTAMYLSLFYLDPKYESYVPCQRKSCNRYFLVSKHSHNKMYCSDKCRNAEAQRRHRERKEQKNDVSADSSQ